MAAGEIKALLFSEGTSVTAGTLAPVGIPGAGAISGKWFSPDGSGAAAAQIGNELVYEFPDATDVKLVTFLRVPSGYISGNQINLKIGYSAVNTSNTVKMLATTYLIRSGTDALTSTTNSYVSTNAAITNGSPNRRLNNTTLDLTSSTGQINSISVSAGDLLAVHLTRDYANDTDTGIVSLIASQTEATFQ